MFAPSTRIPILTNLQNRPNQSLLTPISHSHDSPSNPLAHGATPRMHTQLTMARTGARGRRHVLLLAALVLCAACARAPAARAGALRASTISAAPEPSPYPLPQPRHGGRHASAPSALPPALSLSPDIMPLLPSPGPGDDALAPSDTAATIPSSPSPPNPDALEPDCAFAPFGSAAPAAVSGMQSSVPPPPRVAWAVLPAVWLVAAMSLA